MCESASCTARVAESLRTSPFELFPGTGKELSPGLDVLSGKGSKVSPDTSYRTDGVHHWHRTAAGLRMVPQSLNAHASGVVRGLRRRPVALY